MKISRVLCLLTSVTLLAVGTAAAMDRDADVLALGDSVVFGFITDAGYAYVNAENFIGYPEYVGYKLHSDSVNAGCPGETTGSFLSATAPDNGCRAFRAAFPLHAVYGSTQLAFATAYLKRHRHVRLVTIGLGANDAFLLEDSCAASPNPLLCIEQGLPGLVNTVTSNIAMILADLRGTGFGGTIMIVNYYSLDYSDASQTGLTETLNQAISAPASAYGAAVADVFTAFRTATSNPLVGGNTCHAGLLNVDPTNSALPGATCDVHPSQSGQQLIARTVASAYEAAQR